MKTVMRIAVAIVAITVLAGVGIGRSSAQTIPIAPEWREPIEPFRVIGNIHWVGTADLASFLITTPEGHILLDTPLEPDTDRLLASIRKLGFEPKDIRILLNSQAHFDHTGALAALKKLSGARLMAGRGDAPILEQGGTNEPAIGKENAFPAVPVDRRLDDGDEIVLGGVTLIARVTSGHTPGATSYVTEVTENGQRYKVVFAGSLSVLPAMRLANPPSYPTIAEDFARSIRILESLRPDVFLGAHGGFFNLRQKLQKLRAGATVNPFIDPDGYKQWLARMKTQYEARLKKDRGRRGRRGAEGSGW